MNATALTSQQANDLLKELPKGWTLNPAGHLYKEYKFDDFMGALNLANKMGEIAEKEGHHPDITIAWGKCAVEIWTHSVKGLSKNDFSLAAKIEKLY
jgi:4a-hydroxytetrahydrobiopterin dehydratase